MLSSALLPRVSPGLDRHRLQGMLGSVGTSSGRAISGLGGTRMTFEEQLQSTWGKEENGLVLQRMALRDLLSTTSLVSWPQRGEEKLNERADTFLLLSQGVWREQRRKPQRLGPLCTARASQNKHGPRAPAARETQRAKTLNEYKVDTARTSLHGYASCHTYFTTTKKSH